MGTSGATSRGSRGKRPTERARSRPTQGSSSQRWLDRAVLQERLGDAGPLCFALREGVEFCLPRGALRQAAGLPGSGVNIATALANSLNQGGREMSAVLK